MVNQFRQDAEKNPTIITIKISQNGNSPDVFPLKNLSNMGNEIMRHKTKIWRIKIVFLVNLTEHISYALFLNEIWWQAKKNIM